MRNLACLAALLIATGCSGVTTTSGDQSVVTESGGLRFEASDFLAQPGMLFAKPSVTAEGGTIVARSTRYGSLCRFAVTGHADVQANRIGLHVGFSERLTICTAEIRALSYT